MGLALVSVALKPLRFRGRRQWPHFTDAETEASEVLDPGQLGCLQAVVELRFKCSGQPEFKAKDFPPLRVPLKS